MYCRRRRGGGVSRPAGPYFPQGARGMVGGTIVGAMTTNVKRNADENEEEEDEEDEDEEDEEDEEEEEEVEEKEEARGTTKGSSTQTTGSAAKTETGRTTVVIAAGTTRPLGVGTSGATTTAPLTTGSTAKSETGRMTGGSPEGTTNLPKGPGKDGAAGRKGALSLVFISVLFSIKLLHLF